MKNFNSFFNSLVAMPKRLAMVLTVLFTLGVGSMLGAEVTVSLSDGEHDGTNITWTAADGNITITQSKGTSTTAVNSSYISAPRVYKGHILSFEAKDGYKIKQIDLKYNSTNYGNSMTAGTVVTNNNVTNNTSEVSRTWTTISGGTHVVSSVSSDGLSAIYIQNVASASNVQLRLTSIVITYVEESSIPANPYTVTLKDDDSTLPQSTAGAAITLPSRDGCDGYEFVGWTNTWKAAQTTWTTTAPDIIEAGSYTPTANESLYPVYTKKEGGTPVPATLTASYSSHSGWTATDCGGSSYWILKSGASITSPVISDLSTVTSITFSVRTYGGSSYKTVNVSTSGGTSIGSASASNTTLASKTINVSNLSGSGSIVFSSSTTSSSYGPGINNITINYSTGGSTTYYISVPDCATKTVVTLNPNEGTGGTTSVTATYEQPMPTITPPTLAGYDFQGYFTENGGRGTQYYKADGTSAKDWDKEDATFTLYAYWKAKTYTVTLNNQGATTEGAKSVTATYNAAMPSIASNLPQKTGYTFNGYFDAASGGTQYYKADGTSAKNWDKTANTTLYAQWTSNKTATSLTWSTATYSATIDADNTFPTLIVDPEAIKESVQYTSSEESVATIDVNTGEITLKADGTTTITATFTETATHTGATASYTLTVHPSNCRWVETEIGDIDSGDEVVITMTTASGVTYALPSEKFTSGAPNATSVKLDGKSLESIIPQIVWIIYKNGNNLTFESNYNQGNYLAFTNSDTGVRVNDNTNRNFVVDDVSGYLMNTQTNDARYLGVHNKDFTWYSYKTYSVNTGAQTLKFYKKECLDSETFWVDYNLANVTCTTASPHSQIAKSEPLALNFEAAIGYALPDNVTVTGATPSWDKSTGTLTISNPTANVTITIEALKLHTVTWMVGNSSVLTEDVANGTGVTQTPASNPEGDAIGDCADTFLGWSEKSAGSTPQDAAYYDDLCSAAQMKTKHSSVTSDKTFYAVFATKGSGGIALGTVLWAENFGHFGTKKPSEAGTGTGTTIYGDASITYSQSSNNTKGYSETYAGGTAPELLLAKSNTTWTIAGIPTGGATKMTLSFLSNKTTFNVTSSTAGITISGSQKTWNIETTDEITTFTLTIKNTGGDNARLDNVSLVVSEGGISYSNYVTNCCALALATNLTVSGTTANSATLTWTAPSSTTGITKLQVRNAETDEVVVNNIAVNTTTATITGLTECTSYQYYVVSVGEDCEVVSNIVTAQPFGGAKTVNYNYNGGSGSPALFTTSCTNQTITLPAATRTGYDFNGWYTDATSGTRVGGAGDTYEPATSPVTLYAQWTIKSYTVTWNPNGGNWGGSTSNIVETYEYGAIIDTPEDPKRENGIFKGWNPSVPSNMPAGDKTYTAQWEMVYTLTFVDMNAGGTTSTLTQTSSGQNIVAPTANSEVCDMWTFIGWAPSNSLNGGTDKPTGFIAAGETILGSLITGNKTYYSVYSYNSDNTQEFEVGKSGTYLMYALSSGTKYYATTAKTGGFYGNPETSFATYGPSKFTLTYNKTEEKYIIYHENTTSGKESQGYFELDTSDGNVDVKSETPSLFTIQAGSNGAFIIRTDYSNKVRSFGYDDSFTDYSGDNPVYFEPASEIQYYNAADCGEVETYTMSFHNPFGDENALVWNDAEHEEAYYTDQPLNTSIDVFPTMVYNGWVFIGWTANQQYNDLIGEENLDDENSATNDPASSLTIYSNTAGWAYTLNDNVTMYPVFTKYEDNEDVDLSSGGEYYMYFYRDASYYEDEYFGADNHYQRMYASSVALNSGAFTYTTLCNNAQIFEFIKKGDGWNIRLKNADGTYPAKSYLVNTIENDYAVQSAEPSETWGVSKNPGGDYLMWYRGNSKNTDENNPHYRAKARELGGTSWSFKCYNKDNDASNFYYEVYLGTCENRVFSSNPSNKPIIQLSGDLYVTATNARGVMATSTLKVSARKLNANEKVNITSNSNDVYFSADCTVNFVKANKPTNTLTITASPSGVIEQDIYVHYKPSAEGNGTPASVVVSANLATPNPSVTDDQTIHVRNLPAKFVIATKVGATWYALPADMSSATNPLGVVIEVDETTMTTIAPNTTTYTLWPVKTTATENDRYTNVTGVAYGDRVRFAAVNYEQRGLWANNNNNGSTIRDYAKIDALGADALAAYEWKVTTTVVDGHWQYTLQTDQTQNQNYLRYWTSAEGTPVGPKWGTYNAGENKLYFLPVTETQPFEYSVVEWYPTKVLIQTDAAITSPTVKVDGEAVASPILTNKGGKLYEISNLPLETNPNKLLQISFTDNAINYTNTKVVPIILSRGAKTITGEPFATLTQKVYQYADVVVRDGATLTIDGGTDVANTLLGMTIYPTAKVAVAEGYKLSVHNLTFFGGIDEIYDGSAYTINKYGVPQLSLKGILNKTVTTIDYIMRVDLEQMYSLTVPYDVQLADIKYWDGSNIALGSALYVSAYDGEARANQSKKTWIYETDFESRLGAATLKAGVGYTISAELQAGVGNEYSILRMPMMSNVASGDTETAKTVAVTAWGKDANVTDNHKGWNLVGNPYMTTIQGADDADLVLGYLKETGTGPWEWVDDGIRYVTIPSDDGTYYWQQKFTTAELPPFKNFFVQIGTTGELQFGLGTRQSMPARSTQAAIEKEVEFEILMSNDARQDNTGLLISEEYSPAYEINADLEKMTGSLSVYTIFGGYKLAYNALSPINASEWIPIGYIAPAAGEYTFRLDDVEKIVEQVEHVYVIDYDANNIVDLMTDEYKFTTDKEQNNNRFAINVVLSQDKDNTTTGLDMILGNNAAPIKFIHQDKMYIYNEGIIYDATGKQVTNINK